jgi:hypothetical protein
VVFPAVQNPPAPAARVNWWLLLSQYAVLFNSKNILLLIILSSVGCLLLLASRPYKWLQPASKLGDLLRSTRANKQNVLFTSITPVLQAVHAPGTKS